MAFRAARLDARALVGEVPPGAWPALHEVPGVPAHESELHETYRLD